MRKKRKALCQAMGCQKPSRLPASPVCKAHDPEHLAKLQAGQARWKAAGSPAPAPTARLRKRVRVKPEGVCFHRSAHRMRSLVNLTPEERLEVVPMCGLPADGGENVCWRHATVLANTAAVERMDREAVPQPTPPPLAALQALQRVGGPMQAETAEEIVLDAQRQREARIARDLAHPKPIKLKIHPRFGQVFPIDCGKP